MRGEYIRTRLNLHSVDDDPLKFNYLREAIWYYNPPENFMRYPHRVIRLKEYLDDLLEIYRLFTRKNGQSF
jgi:hypothetical protein